MSGWTRNRIGAIIIPRDCQFNAIKIGFNLWSTCLITRFRVAGRNGILWPGFALECRKIRNVLWEINCFTVDTLWIRLGAVDGTRDPIICSDPFVINYIVLLLSSDVLSCLCLHGAVGMMMMCQVWVYVKEILPFRSQSQDRTGLWNVNGRSVSRLREIASQLISA